MYGSPSIVQDKKGKTNKIQGQKMKNYAHNEGLNMVCPSSAPERNLYTNFLDDEKPNRNKGGFENI